MIPISQYAYEEMKNTIDYLVKNEQNLDPSFYGIRKDATTLKDLLDFDMQHEVGHTFDDFCTTGVEHVFVEVEKPVKRVVDLDRVNKEEYLLSRNTKNPKKYVFAL